MGIEDKELQEKLVKKLYKLRILNQEVGDRQLRHAIDELLTKAYLLAKYGNLDKLNGGNQSRSTSS